MLSALKRKLGFATKPTAPTELTFKLRVQNFWAWYTEVGPRFLATIDAGDCAKLTDEVSTKVKELLDFGAWEFGPGANKQGHSFTLTGEGDRHLQLLTAYWLSRAPVLPGWMFYASRQACAIESHRMTIGGREFNPIEFWLTVTPNSDREKIDLTVWHPLFAVMEEKQRWIVLFLFLDEVLGEIGTQQWIGEIKLNNERLAQAMPIAELPAFVKETQAKTGWKKYPPGEAFTGYSIKEQHQRFARGDIYTGTTSHMNLVNDYLDAEGDMENPLAGKGADFVYVAFDVSFLPRGQEVDVRSRIEDALDAALRAEASGQSLRGAMGRNFAYIDLLILDGAASLAIMRRVLSEQRLPPETTINFFAKENRSRQILLGTA